MYKPDVQLWRVRGIGPLTGWDFYEGNKSKLLRQGALVLSLVSNVKPLNGLVLLDL